MLREHLRRMKTSQGEDLSRPYLKRVKISAPASGGGAAEHLKRQHLLGRMPGGEGRVNVPPSGACWAAFAPAAVPRSRALSGSLLFHEPPPLRVTPVSPAVNTSIEASPRSAARRPRSLDTCPPGGTRSLSRGSASLLRQCLLLFSSLIPLLVSS